MITKYINQFFHQAAEPLDSSSEVDTKSDLNDTSKVVPYIGKIVHVKEDGVFYVCARTERQAVWKPAFNDQGTEIYLSAEDGTVLTISAVRDGATYRLRISWDNDGSEQASYLDE